MGTVLLGDGMWKKIYGKGKPYLSIDHANARVFG